MKLYIGNKKYSSWSLRPWLAMKHFGIQFDEEVIPLDMPTTTQDIKKVSPSARVPALKDGSLTIWDSLAIMEYLNEQYPGKGMWPSKREDRALARSISAEMHSGFQALREHLSHKVHKIYPDFVVPPDAKKDIDRIIEIWNEALSRSKGPYLFKEFTIADAMYAPVVNRFRTYSVKLTGLAAEYQATMLKHPGMVQWKEDAERETLVAPLHD